MLAMNPSQSKAGLIGAVAISLAAIGSATYLASSGDLAGSSVLSLLILILGVSGAATVSHVTGQVVQATNGHTTTTTATTTPPAVPVARLETGTVQAPPVSLTVTQGPTVPAPAPPAAGQAAGPAPASGPAVTTPMPATPAPGMANPPAGT